MLINRYLEKISVAYTEEQPSKSNNFPNMDRLTILIMYNFATKIKHLLNVKNYLMHLIQKIFQQC